MEPGPGWIGKHVEAIELGLRGIVQRSGQAMLLPVSLPLRFDDVVIVSFAHKLAGNTFSHQLDVLGHQLTVDGAIPDLEI